MRLGPSLDILGWLVIGATTIAMPCSRIFHVGPRQLKTFAELEINMHHLRGAM